MEHHIIKMGVAEMRVLRWISGNIRKDKIWNEEICLKIVVATIDEKIRVSHLRCWGHVQRITTNALAKKSELIQVEGTKKVEKEQNSH